MSKDTPDRVDKWFDSLSDACLDYDKEFDSKITYIGAGVIALSIAFATKGGNTPAECRCLFIVGEILAVTAVILNLLSFPISKIFARYYQNVVSRYIDMDYEGELNPDIDTQEKKMYRTILYYNILCLALLIAGIICICVFVFNNL